MSSIMFPDCTDSLSYLSQANKRSYNLEWEINQFDIMLEMRTNGPSFPQEDTSADQFYIIIRKESVIDYGRFKDSLSFSIEQTRSSGMARGTFYSLSFKTHSSPSKVVNFHGKLINESTIGSIIIEKVWECNDWLNLNMNHKATITCDVWCVASFNHFPVKSTLKYAKSEDSVRYKDAVLEKEEFKDFVFIVQKKKIGVHKVLLALESPVFSSMFSLKMKESLTSTAVIDDVNPDIFEKMLKSIYQQEVSKDDLKTSAIDLFKVAHKYEIKKLEQVCINFLYDNLSATNATTILNLANQYNISQLRDRSLQFLKR